MKALIPLLGLTLATALVAQSPLRSIYASNNGGAAGGQVFFDLQVSSAITITGFDVNLNAAAGVTGTIEVRTRNGSYLGQELSAAAWPTTAVASGPFTSAGVNAQTPVCFATPITLPPGLTGFCVRYVGAGALYTNGTGTVVPGGGGANQTYATAEAILLTGAAQNAPFVGSIQPRVWNGSINYTVGATALPCSASPATNLVYGAGCYRRVGSWYDNFNLLGVTPATAAGIASANLTGRIVSWLPNGPGYVVLPNIAGVAFVPPSPAASVLTGFAPNNDDGDLSVTLTTPFPYAGNLLNSLTVHTNGMVSTGSNHAFFNLNGLTSFVPTVRRLLDAPEALWACWHDFNPTELNSGQIKFEEIGGVAFFTWDDVESYPGNATTSSPNRSTIQFQFDSNTGQVNLVCVTINAAGATTSAQALSVSDIYLVGYSQPGLGADNGETDITTFTQIDLDGLADRRPLSLTTADRPILGNLVRFATTDETPSATPFGVLFFSLADLAPFSPVGLDLGIIGAAGCVANMDPNLAPLQIVLTNLVPGGMNSQFAIPAVPTAVGLQWYAQSVWLDPAVNTFGILTSNAIRQTLGTW